MCIRVSLLIIIFAYAGVNELEGNSPGSDEKPEK